MAPLGRDSRGLIAPRLKWLHRGANSQLEGAGAYADCPLQAPILTTPLSAVGQGLPDAARHGVRQLLPRQRSFTVRDRCPSWAAGCGQQRSHGPRPATDSRARNNKPAEAGLSSPSSTRLAFGGAPCRSAGARNGPSTHPLKMPPLGAIAPRPP